MYKEEDILYFDAFVDDIIFIVLLSCHIRNEETEVFQERITDKMRHKHRKMLFAPGCRSDQRKRQTQSLLLSKPISQGDDTRHGSLGGLG